MIFQVLFHQLGGPLFKENRKRKKKSFLSLGESSDLKTYFSLHSTSEIKWIYLQRTQPMGFSWININTLSRHTIFVLQIKISTEESHLSSNLSGLEWLLFPSLGKLVYPRGGWGLWFQLILICHISIAGYRHIYLGKE